MNPRCFLIVLGLLGSGCVSDSGSVDSGADGSSDGTVMDSPTDASQEGLLDAGSDAEGGVTTYHDMANAMFWETYDLTSNVDPAAKGFEGVVFDGRYVYLVPSFIPPNGPYVGLVVRYDTTLPFKMPGSWSKIDLVPINAKLKGFVGGIFDGRYVYLMPYSSAINTYSSTVARYDTLSSFTNANSWTSFDVATVNAQATGYTSGAFDGQYLYMAPVGTNGRALRYDTQAPFAQAGGWTAFDLMTVDPKARSYEGIAYDGRYLYYSPFYDGTTYSGLALRHDTQQAFNAGWNVFDMATINMGARGFIGSIFDGRFVYFVPTYNGADNGLIVRYDSQSPFGQTGSWTSFDLSTKNAAAKKFEGGQFDGRYVYFSPRASVVARYDVQASFGSLGAWDTLDLTSIDPNAKGFIGSAFDGRYVYFGNYDTGTIARFDAKTPSSLPPKPQGSFF